MVIKERISEDHDSRKIWKNEVYILRLINEKLKNFSTPMFIDLLDETSLKIKNKYMVMEYIKGKKKKKIKMKMKIKMKIKI